MTRITFTLVLALPFALIACHDEDEEPTDNTIPICNTDDEGTYVSVADITGDTLSAEIGYSGCDLAEAVTVCWEDGSFMESNPVQARLVLLAPAGDCLAYFEESVDIDITGLRESYEAGYQTTTGTIIVQLNGTSATYSF